jgi:uncharacterized protein YjlB
MARQEINEHPKVVTHLVGDSGIFPNNPRLPLVILQTAFLFQGTLEPGFIEKTFTENGWTGGWRNGLYPFHHYHSTAHEVLGIYSGSVRVQFGGEEGPEVAAAMGDVLVLPAGLAHRNVWSSHDFRVVGAYPVGTTWDMNYGKEGERPGTDQNIAQVPLPPADPVYGAGRALIDHWRS